MDPAGKPFGSLSTRLVRRVGGLRVGFVGLTADMQLTTHLSGLGRSGPVAAPPGGRIRLEAGSVSRQR